MNNHVSRIMSRSLSVSKFRGSRSESADDVSKPLHLRSEEGTDCAGGELRGGVGEACKLSSAEESFRRFHILLKQQVQAVRACQQRVSVPCRTGGASPTVVQSPVQVSSERPERRAPSALYHAQLSLLLFPSMLVMARGEGAVSTPPGVLAGRTRCAGEKRGGSGGGALLAPRGVDVELPVELGPCEAEAPALRGVGRGVGAREHQPQRPHGPLPRLRHRPRAELPAAADRLVARVLAQRGPLGAVGAPLQRPVPGEVVRPVVPDGVVVDREPQPLGQVKPPPGRPRPVFVAGARVGRVDKLARGEQLGVAVFPEGPAAGDREPPLHDRVDKPLPPHLRPEEGEEAVGVPVRHVHEVVGLAQVVGRPGLPPRAAARGPFPGLLQPPAVELEGAPLGGGVHGLVQKPPQRLAGPQEGVLPDPLDLLLCHEGVAHALERLRGGGGRVCAGLCCAVTVCSASQQRAAHLLEVGLRLCRGNHPGRSPVFKTTPLHEDVEELRLAHRHLRALRDGRHCGHGEGFEPFWVSLRNLGEVRHHVREGGLVHVAVCWPLLLPKQPNHSAHVILCEAVFHNLRGQLKKGRHAATRGAVLISPSALPQLRSTAGTTEMFRYATGVSQALSPT
eukprot:CAMPEP_0177595880 /NCGR_PEP_ID=MMETSP0419_2-20121207/10649_1 /TAXON_ID=582737 /ORGANISM="Tetraselmis sp., Strain GSL018" /LENGTH=620 /DNA_ID=CAMNT_0019087483 /DNA_START=83 /DNA_END=1947 /DNA_ORIENTATION=-